MRQVLGADFDADQSLTLARWYSACDRRIHTMEIVATSSQPMLCILTRSSERASAIASTVKMSLDQVLSFIDEQGIRPVGRPAAVFSDWNGRLVTIEAGYPVGEVSLALATGRVQARRIPGGSAAHWSFDTVSADYARRHQDVADEIRSSGLRMTGTTWEIYDKDPVSGIGVTEFYAQLLGPRESSPFGG
jgi:hypothetical protein